MSLLTLIPELRPLFDRSGRDWTEEERLRVVMWLNERPVRDWLLRYARCRLRRVFSAATVSDVEDVWSSFCLERLGGLMRLYDPAAGAFVPLLLLGLKQACMKAGLQLRDRSVRLTLEAHAIDVPVAGDSPEHAVQRQETARWLRAGIATLSVQDRAVIVQHYFQYKDLGEIADAMRVSVNTAKVRLFRARRRLAAYLSTEGSTSRHHLHASGTGRRPFQADVRSFEVGIDLAPFSATSAQEPGTTTPKIDDGATALGRGHSE